MTTTYRLAGMKWGIPALGSDGGVVTWSYASTQLSSRSYSFDPPPAGEFLALIRKAFDRWEGVAQIDFVEVPDTALSQIRLGFDTIDGAGGVLGEASSRYLYGTGIGSVGRLTEVEIRFEGAAEGWREAAGTLLSRGGSDFYGLALHEIGHALGLGHVDGPQIMNAALRPGVHDLQSGDLAGAVALYGLAVREAPPISPAPGLAPAHRFFETRTGEHFYTTSPVERDDILARLPNFTYEGAAWAVPDPGVGTIDLFRFYNQVTQGHFYTTSAVERAAIQRSLPHYRDEGVAFQVWAAEAQVTDAITLARFFNPQSGQHHFAPPGEAAAIRAGGAGPHWVEEGPGFRVSLLGDDALF